MTSTPARRTTGRDCSSGWLMLALLASAVSTIVIAVEYGNEAETRSCALAMRLVATSSIALVIFFVDRVVRIRRRRTRTEPGIALLLHRWGALDALDGLLGLHALGHRLSLFFLEE